jgi:hypothetical protein
VIAHALRRVEEGMQAIYRGEISEAMGQPTKGH